MLHQPTERNQTGFRPGSHGFRLTSIHKLSALLQQRTRNRPGADRVLAGSDHAVRSPAATAPPPIRPIPCSHELVAMRCARSALHTGQPITSTRRAQKERFTLECAGPAALSPFHNSFSAPWPNPGDPHHQLHPMLVALGPDSRS